MQIFSTKGAKLAEIVEEQFPLEREVQRLTEANLQELFDLILVKSESELHGLRIDTLAFDRVRRICYNQIQKGPKLFCSRSRYCLSQPYA